jgi:hypothetical protein
MSLHAWWSRSEEVLVAMDGPTANLLHNWLLGFGAQVIIPPVAQQLTEQLKYALRDGPAVKR